MKKLGAEAAAAHTEASPPAERGGDTSMGLQQPRNRALCEEKGAAQQAEGLSAPRGWAGTRARRRLQNV